MDLFHLATINYLLLNEIKINLIKKFNHENKYI